MKNTLRMLSGPGLAIVVYLVAFFSGMPFSASVTAAITGWCVAWWVVEPVPIPVTSMLPFVAFPLTGVLDHKTVATAYGHTLILLLLGGFILSTAMARSGAHRRLAVGLVRLVGGGGGRRLVLGFMLATAICSMWISNTATTLMMLPVAMAILEQDERGQLRLPLLLGIAYAASIGGLGTPVGTPPNVIFMGIYKEATGTEVAFLDWMKIGIPAVCVLLPVAWLHLTRGLKEARPLTLPAMDEWSTAERRVLVVFSVTAALWVFRTGPYGGWSELFQITGAGDSTIALGAVVALFVISDGRDGRLLDWESANQIPWGLLLLFGGGIAIARAFEASGLSHTVGRILVDDLGLATWPVVLMMLMMCFVVTFLTEVTSNTATTTLLMPILAAAGIAAGIDPARWMIPAALSASCAFMLPVATAPNAIIFGTGRVATTEMAREGVVLNLFGVAALTAICALML